MHPQRSASQTDFGIPFPLDKHTTKFIPYSYSPSIIHNQLTSAQINELPRNVEFLDRQQPQSVQRDLETGLAISLIFSLLAARGSMCPKSALVGMSQVTCIGMGITGCLVFRSYGNTEKKVQDLIDKENQALVEKGLRWCLPRDSRTLELHADDKFYKTNLSIKDEEVMWSSAFSESHQDEKTCRSSPAMNDGEGIGNATKYRDFLGFCFKST